MKTNPEAQEHLKKIIEKGFDFLFQILFGLEILCRELKSPSALQSILAGQRILSEIQQEILSLQKIWTAMQKEKLDELRRQVQKEADHEHLHRL